MKAVEAPALGSYPCVRQTELRKPHESRGWKAAQQSGCSSILTTADDPRSLAPGIWFSPPEPREQAQMSHPAALNSPHFSPHHHPYTPAKKIHPSDTLGL